eukprot:jgi/Galph1/3690/GphlegSOOS_G2326.1
MNTDIINRYCRQMLLPQFGKRGQEQLMKKKILVVGAGGLGCPAALYLAGAGVGKLCIVDSDLIERSNLHRQVAYTDARSGLSKAYALKESVQNLNPNIQVDALNVRLSQSNALDICNDHDIVLDCTDNVMTRYVINDACALLSKPLVSGAAIGFDGQITVYCASVDCPCYRCIFPEPPPLTCVSSCDASGVLGPIPGVIGCLQALEALKLAANIENSQPLNGRMITFEGLETSFRSFQLRKRNLACVVCGEKNKNFNIVEYDYESFVGGGKLNIPQTVDFDGWQKKIERISPTDAKNRLETNQEGNGYSRYFCLDVRPKNQYDLCHINGFHNIPLDELCSRQNEIRAHVENDEQVLVICRKGNASQKAVVLLHNLGISSVKDIIGGIEEWRKQCDPSLPSY